MQNLLIIGAGGVGRVTTLKCVESGAFGKMTLASRREEKCQEIVASCPEEVTVNQLDASETAEVRQAIRIAEADIVINVALPYQNMAIMQACLQEQAHYVDTAAPESPERLYTAAEDGDWYGPQWQLHDGFQRAGRLALLGAGSDPGMVNAFCAYAASHLLDLVTTIDIIDINVGDHGYPFATNFNPEINLREVQAPAHYYQDGNWRQVPALSVSTYFDLPEVGRQQLFLMDHDELHSLYRFFPDATHIKFWMGFGDEYRKHFEVMNNIGMLSPEPVDYYDDSGGVSQIIPLKLLRNLLPDPASLAESYTGKTCIGVLLTGNKAGEKKSYFLYNICDHETAYDDVGSQAISFTAGTCAAAAAATIADGAWHRSGVYNVEALPPKPFLDRMTELGMGWNIRQDTVALS
jgi:saccharopine dehydrogenase (NAD+, L-lysine-forming)